MAQQHADALSALIAGTAGSLTTEVVLHVREDGATLDDGSPLPLGVVARIASDAFIRALIHDAEGRPIDASSRRRHPTARQKRVVKERDRACVDCGSTGLLEYDHVPDFAVSGRTVVDELELRCAPCHRRRHGHAAA
ncbi:HNH endonuclease signature motif containing protein [Ilumatobacter fluminis]|uniref:HNH endonuclease signature motif containing protein n=1 Tax=Ilumatobacter fluminis TaxID=467091 RepID=UPI00105B8ECD|nr:HNH endonuclease signature motif containing protein [Ilumatobacter fluminis]